MKQIICAMLALAVLFTGVPILAEDTVMIFEAENGWGDPGLTVSALRGGYSGTGYVSGFTSASPCWNVTVTVPRAGHYTLRVHTASDSYKVNILMLDGQEQAKVTTAGTNDFEYADIPSVWLHEGDNTVTFKALWGFTDFDAIEVLPGAPVTDDWYHDVDAVPVNPNANEKTRNIMAYLASIYGTKTLSGQFCAPNNVMELWAIMNATDKECALRGFDMMFCSPQSPMPTAREVELAAAWSEKGGLCSFCWHWFQPKGKPAFAVGDGADFDLAKAVTDIDLSMLSYDEIEQLYKNGQISEEACLIIRDIDAISEQLKRLRDENITVIWRPLHEASGGWFWWGASGADSYLWLWRLMFNRQTNYHNLNNLIWLWNGQSADWYVGDDFCDILGYDIYAEKRSYAAQCATFIETAAISGRHKMVALSENGVIPDPDLMDRDNTHWLMFCVWYGTFLVDSYNRLSQEYTETEQLIKTYLHDQIITLDELPSFNPINQEP